MRKQAGSRLTETCRGARSRRVKFGCGPKVSNALFKQNIGRERTTLQFNRFWSVRSVTEYNNNGGGRRRLGLSQLVTYLPSPNTAVYVSYNNLLASPLSFGNRTNDFEERFAGWNRQRHVFFIKLTYNVQI